MKISKLKKLFPLIGIFIFVYIVYSIGVEKILSTFLKANLMYVPPAVGLIFLYFIIQNLKWKYLLNKQGMVMGFWYLMKIYLIGSFYGVITPGRVGTLIRVRYIKKKTGKKLGECSVSVVLDKLLDLLALFLIAAVGMILLARYISNEAFIIIGLFFILFFGGAAVSLREGTSRGLLRMFWKVVIPKKMRESTRDTFNAFYKNIIDTKYLIAPLAVTVLSWVVLYSSNYLIALSLGIDVPFFTFIAIMALSTIVGLIPVTVGGWGTREATLIFLLAIFSVSSELVVVMSVISSLLGYVFPVAFGAVFAFMAEGGRVEVENNEKSA